MKWRVQDGMDNIKPKTVQGIADQRRCEQCRAQDGRGSSMTNVEPKPEDWRAQDNINNIQSQTVQTVEGPSRYEQCRAQTRRVAGPRQYKQYPDSKSTDSSVPASVWTMSSPRRLSGGPKTIWRIFRLKQYRQ